MNTYREPDGKACPRCETFKLWAEFGNHAGARDKHQTYCRPCSAELARESDERHRLAKAARYAEKLARFVNEKATKVCRYCGEEKPHIDFYAHRSTADGRANRCTACERERLRRKRAGRLDEVRRISAARYANPVLRARDLRARKRAWLLKYGMTPEGYDRLLTAQGGACAICRTPGETFANRSLHVDHDHKTGQVRGLLCSSCNWGLGHFKDNESLLRDAINYLKENPAQRVSII